MFDLRSFALAILLLAAPLAADASALLPGPSRLPFSRFAPAGPEGRELGAGGEGRLHLAALETPSILPAQADAATTTLPNGLRVVCRRDPAVPLVAIDVFVRSDDAIARQPALGSLLARTLTASTTNVTSESLATQIGDLGGNLAASWQTDTLQIRALVVRDRFRDTSFLLSDILRNADFDPQGTGVEDARQQLLSDIDTGDNGLFQTAYALARKTVYAGSPYALPALGTENDAERLARADLVRAYHRLFVPANMTVVVDGDVDPQYALQKVSADFSDFPMGRGAPSGRRLLPPEAPASLTTDPAPVHKTVPGLAEVCVMVGYQAPSASSPDYPALLVANALLGTMKTSRLFQSLREKLGLGYEVGSLLNTRASGGDLVAYALAAPAYPDKKTKKTVPTVALLQAQILHQSATLKTTPPTTAETLRAVHYLLGADKIRRERLEDRAAILGQETLLHGDAALWETRFARQLKAVTPAEVQRVAARYFVRPAIVVIGPDSAGPGDTAAVPVPGSSR